MTAGTPYTSGQQISLNVAANPVIDTTNLTAAGAPTTGLFYVEECTDPGGLTANLPTADTGCEAATLVTGPKPTNGDGSLNLVGTSGPTVFDLPDGNLGSPTMTGTCDVTPNQCVLGIFAANPSHLAGNGFAYPHLFSAPFNVVVGDGFERRETIRATGRHRRRRRPRPRTRPWWPAPPRWRPTGSTPRASPSR